MPYNNTPIVPPQEYTGVVSLPLARVKKIINADDETGACSNNAAFVITVATEMFIQHMVEQTHNVVKAERRPRRNIQYRDVANAVARVDNLEFLADVVPRTMTYKAFQEKKAKDDAPKTNGRLPNGQTTLDQMRNKDMDAMEMEQHDTVETNGTEKVELLGLDSRSPLSSKSPEARVEPQSSGSYHSRGVPARHFDAVRNGYDELCTAMEE